jgi:hypothetical protein
MKKQILKMGAVALCVTLVLASLAACSGKAAAMTLAHVDVYTYVGNTLGPKLTNTGDNKVSEANGRITVNVAADVTEVEFDVANFFTGNEKYKGKNFYFTRSDVKKGDGTLIKGYAWVQVGGDAGNRTYKKLGYESDTTVTAKTKEEIAALDNREGEARLYIITTGTQSGKHVVYLDATTGSSVSTGETNVVFMFHGHNGKTAKLDVKVIKATEATEETE